PADSSCDVTSFRSREKKSGERSVGAKAGSRAIGPRAPGLSSACRDDRKVESRQDMPPYRRRRDCASGAQFVSVGGGSWRLDGAETPGSSRSASGSSPPPRISRRSPSREEGEVGENLPDHDGVFPV